MTQPDFDQRRVKRIGDCWTIETKAQLANDDVLCRHCGIFGICPVSVELSKLEDNYEAIIGVRRCKMFRPIIGFTGPIGLDGNFNTFRLGKAWSERVKVGSTISLADSRNQNIIGLGRVTGIDCGPLEDMLDHHAHFNHAMDGIDIKKASSELLKVLLRAYGPQMVQLDRAVSVIYMDRVDLPA